MKKKYLALLLQIALLGNVMAEGLHLFKHDDKYGYFDDKLRVAIFPEYYTAEDFHDGFAVVSKKVEGRNVCSVIDENGRVPFSELEECGVLP